ncbi:uncharacterized protein AB675_3560 [Cyphellophora attinorum]|uniref:Uncharacterized protein n=1 Tax=Cyphellophora attinorum TaxID=1664694 RepID=A0A0N1H8N1_9EURO|nr:uncharacterized protein AB675_3560 [Phialophora attinorum]KPI39576.1 hypothetical protein AB675_3560 [Phialophora attinorum]
MATSTIPSIAIDTVAPHKEYCGGLRGPYSNYLLPLDRPKALRAPTFGQIDDLIEEMQCFWPYTYSTSTTDLSRTETDSFLREPRPLFVHKASANSHYSEDDASEPSSPLSDSDGSTWPPVTPASLESSPSLWTEPSSPPAYTIPKRKYQRASQKTVIEPESLKPSSAFDFSRRDVISEMLDQLPAIVYRKPIPSMPDGDDDVVFQQHPAVRPMSRHSSLRMPNKAADAPRRSLSVRLKVNIRRPRASSQKM